MRKDEGGKIDPETAEVTWRWGLTLDPYGIHPDLPKEKCQVQRNYFARSPGSDMWVHFDDLPEATRRILSEKAAQDILPLGKVATYETPSIVKPKWHSDGTRTGIALFGNGPLPKR